MEAVAILIISIAGLTLLVIAVISVASNLEKQNISVKKTNNNSFQRPYKSKQLESESTKAYKEILKKSRAEWKDKNAIYTGKEQKGKNGGRYRLRETKNGKKYRQYY